MPLVNDVIVVPLRGIDCCVKEKLDSFNSALDLVKGEAALIEPIEVAGETPSEIYDRRLWG